MAVVLFFFTLFSIAIFGLIALFARGARDHVPANERRDLEENSIIDEEWEWVRRRRCLPTRCSRALGQPPHPRRDLTCEICAATFMERHWRYLVGVVPEHETCRVSPRRARGATAHERVLNREILPRAPGTRGAREPIELLEEPVPTAMPPALPAGRWQGRRRDLLGLGFALVLLGVALLALSTHVIVGGLLTAGGLGVALQAGLRRSR